MRLSYHHANPGGGNESLLLRYQSSETGDGSVCVLIDAGAETQPERILRPSDELAGICLTHAHLDHYQSIETCRREETTIYASKPTAAILGDVFDVAARDYGVATNQATARAIEPVDGWTDIAPGISVHPVPAGHVPGGVGYLFKLDGDGTTVHVLATGDFTRRRAAGYPGFDPSSYLDIDVLVLTVATSTGFRQNLSEALSKALQRAHSGARTLVATSGLLGTQVTYLLDALATEFDRPVPVRAAGQVAKIYETLGYAGKHVETVPEFSDPQECLAPGAITVAGPEVPHEQSSGRLFSVLRSDPGACVIQLLGSGTAPVDEGQCTIHSYRIVDHPTRETIDEVHGAVDPHTTLVTHRHRGAGAEFNDLDSIVWSPTDAAEYTLYEDGEWVAPPWMDRGPSPAGSSPQGTGTVGSQVGDDVLGALSLPSLDRHETVDLEAEGVDLARVEEVLSQRTAYNGATGGTGAGGAVPARQDGPVTAAEGGDPAANTDGRAPVGSDETPSTTDDGSRTPPGGLVDTATADVDGVDPRIVDALEAGEIEPEDVLQALRLAEREDLPGGQPEPPHGDGGDGREGDADGDRDGNVGNDRAGDRDGDSEGDHTPGPGGDGPKSETASESLGDRTASGASPDDGVSDAPGTRADAEANGAKAADDDAASEGSDHPAAGESDSVEPAPDEAPESDVDDTGDTLDDEAPLATAGSPAALAADGESRTVQLTLSPLTAALTTATVEVGDFETREQVVVVAVRGYLGRLLRDPTVEIDAPPDESAVRSDGSLQGALETVANQTDDYGSASELLETAIAQTVGSGSETTMSVPDLAPYLPLVDAVVESDRQPMSSHQEVVAMAVRRQLAAL